MPNIELGFYEIIWLKILVKHRTAELTSDIEWTQNKDWKVFLEKEKETYSEILEKLEKAIDEA